MLDIPEPWSTVLTVVVYLVVGAASALWGRSKLAGGSSSPATAAGPDPFAELRRQLLFVLARGIAPPDPVSPSDPAMRGPGGPLGFYLDQEARRITSDPALSLDAKLGALRPLLQMQAELAGGLLPLSPLPTPPAPASSRG